MQRRHVSLSPVIDRTIESQVKLGRYKDFSAAIQDAVWNYFIGPDSPYEEYGVTPKEVERAHTKVLPRSSANAAPENSSPGVRDSHPIFLPARVQAAVADATNGG